MNREAVLRGRASASGRAGVVLALLVVAAFAFGVRAIGLEHVFAGDGTVVFDNGDGSYHARLSHYSFSHFPSFLSWDPYLAGPLGGAVPWPPGYDLVVAGVARALGADDIDHVLAWFGPALGALTTLAVFAAARVLGSRWAALCAAALYASFGAAITYSVVGNGDHHAWVGLLAGTWLALALSFAAPDTRPRRLLLLAAGIALVRALLLAGWSGSLLYVAIADGALLLAAVLTGDAHRLRLLGASAVVTAALAAPFVWTAGELAGGAFSTITLSNLHLLVATGIGVVALVTAAYAQRRPDASAPRRLAIFFGAGVMLAGLLLGIGPIRGELLPALRFLTLRDAAGAMTVEQFPLFPLFGREPVMEPTGFFGGWVYALPLAPLAALWAGRDAWRRVPARVLAVWTAPFVVLAVSQTRYGNDLAAPVAVCFALGLETAAQQLSARVRLAPAVSAVVVSALAAALLLPSLRGFVSGLPPSWEYLRHGHAAGDPLLRDSSGTLARFGQQVRAATPETAGFDDAEAAPAYGIVSYPSIGHALRYYARRPVAADNFWDKFETFERANRLLGLSEESDAVESARVLRARYVVTMPTRAAANSINDRLHYGDGHAASGKPRLEHFRLVTEGPRGGVPLLSTFGVQVPALVPPYKLFDIVPGAVLEAHAAPGTPVVAELQLETPTERRFTHRAQTIADAGGVARLRVPYPTGARAPTHATGPWSVKVGDQVPHSVDVTEEDVTSGAVVPVQQSP